MGILCCFWLCSKTSATSFPDTSWVGFKNWCTTPRSSVCVAVWEIWFLLIGLDTEQLCVPEWLFVQLKKLCSTHDSEARCVFSRLVPHNAANFLNPVTWHLCPEESSSSSVYRCVLLPLFFSSFGQFLADRGEHPVNIYYGVIEKPEINYLLEKMDVFPGLVT